MRKRIQFAVAAFFVSAGIIYAGDTNTQKIFTGGKSDSKMSADEKRDWLRTRINAKLSSARDKLAVESRLNAMSPEQLNRLIQVQRRQESKQQQKLLAAREQLGRSQAYRNQLVRQYQQRLAQQRNAGFAPVVTWLPEGVNMGASAVISPDRRYVRVNASPFFSSIGPVRTFNFGNGQYQQAPYYVQPPYQYLPQHNHNYYQHAKKRNPAYPQIWHDGLRTRIGPRP